jgi:uncharacterized protein (TIGR04255 family)
MEIYANAPISEAALDIRVSAAKDFTDEDLEKARDESYPDLFQRPMTVQFQVEVNAQKRSISPPAMNAVLGFAYRSVDQLNVYQVRPDGFTHNRLAPYQEWNVFAAEAKRLWNNYRTVIKPISVELIGLNYINDIEIPLGENFAEYVKTYIEVPTELPQILNAFSLGYQVTIPEDAGFLKIGQTYGIPKREGFGVIRLNIQAFRQMNLHLNDDNETSIWEAFKALRKAKDDAFEACITDKVREMIR